MEKLNSACAGGDTSGKMHRQASREELINVAKLFPDLVIEKELDESGTCREFVTDYVTGMEICSFRPRRNGESDDDYVVRAGGLEKDWRENVGKLSGQSHPSVSPPSPSSF